MNHLYLLVKGYGTLLRGLVRLAAWIVALGTLSAIITLPLWLAASRFPTAYTTISLIVIVAGLGRLLIGGRRPTGRTLVWMGAVVVMVLGIVLGSYILTILALVAVTGLIAYRLA
ncbi:MAG: hypothetical protein WD492_07075 [Alkalispirochaeta sp.]